MKRMSDKVIQKDKAIRGRPNSGLAAMNIYEPHRKWRGLGLAEGKQSEIYGLHVARTTAAPLFILLTCMHFSFFFYTSSEFV